jgi:hypothetical protein
MLLVIVMLYQKQVLPSMCNEVEVVNKFIDEYLSNDENIEPVYH